MEYFAGIDIGSTTTELVILDNNSKIRSYNKTQTGGHIKSASEKVLQMSLEEMGILLNDISYFVATGYGRKNLPFVQKSVTEITCYGRGASYLNPDVRLVIDIGGQDSKVISIDEKGNVQNFVMNDKCAAGTGRFLEMIARTFDISINKLGELSKNSNKNLSISSICAIFAETEMISLFSNGESKEDIIYAAHKSVCEKTINLVDRIGINGKIMFCGGVANNSGIVKQLEIMLGVKVLRPDIVEQVGAIGAALIAKSNQSG